MDEACLPIEAKIREILGSQIELVELRIFYAAGAQSLRCLVDRVGGGITLDECGRINRAISEYLESSQVLGQDYSVEVHSPGLDRLLKTRPDFSRVKGRLVGLWLSEPVNGKTYWEGKVVEAGQQTLSILIKEAVLGIEYRVITTGKERII
jgi:ribosome maturation factor RimP